MIELQPGLSVCCTTAQDIGATDAGRTFDDNDRFIHFTCQLAGMFQGWIERHDVTLSAGDLSCGHAAGERFHVRHCAQLHNIEVMVTPEALSALAGIEAFGGTGVFIHRLRARRPALRSANILARLVTHGPQQRCACMPPPSNFCIGNWPHSRPRRRPCLPHRTSTVC